MSWIGALAGYTAAHPQYALLVTFLAAIIEAVAVLGIVIPGTPIMMVAAGVGAMAGQSMLPFLGLAIAGAVIGDSVSFWVGARYAVRIASAWPFSRWPRLIRDAARFFDRFGVASVALCRLLPVLRSTVPLVAGMAGMPKRRFLLANIGSACVWAPIHIYPAQLAGLTLNELELGDWRSVAVGAAVLIVCALAAYLTHRALTARLR